MSSSSTRQRKDRASTSSLSEEQQIWQTVRSHVRSLEKFQSTSTIDLVTLETRRSRYIEELSKHGLTDTQEDNLEGSSELKSAYAKLESSYQLEHQEIARALERVELLLALRDDSTSVGGESTGRRKKRRVDGRSVSPTPSLHNNRAYSPTLAGDVSATEDSRDRKRSSGKANAQVAGSVSTSSGTANRRLTSANSFTSTPGTGRDASDNYGKDGGHIDPARARREVLAHQLPLKKGRKVAFRQPNKTKVGVQSSSNPASSASGGGGRSSTGAGAGHASSGAGLDTGADEDGETWIMATVIECINNDKNRYVVQDEEDPAMPTYNTTLKAVVPLPDHSRTLPPEDYKPGTHVLGLYPDTSCFYRAIVRGGGPGLGGRSNKKSRKPDELLNASYQLEFEDDDGAIRDVPASLVVERP